VRLCFLTVHSLISGEHEGRGPIHSFWTSCLNHVVICASFRRPHASQFDDVVRIFRLRPSCPTNRALPFSFKGYLHAGTDRGHRSRSHTYSNQSGELKGKWNVDTCSCAYWKYLTFRDKGPLVWGVVVRKLPIQSIPFQSNRICSTSSETGEACQLGETLKGRSFRAAEKFEVVSFTWERTNTWRMERDTLAKWNYPQTTVVYRLELRSISFRLQNIKEDHTNGHSDGLKLTQPTLLI
jgi:hypothetical protein